VHLRIVILYPCTLAGGHLASFHKLSLNTWVYETFINDPTRKVWLGACDTDSLDVFLPAEQRTFVWSDGTPFDFTNW